MTKTEALTAFKRGERVMLTTPKYQDAISYPIIKAYKKSNGNGADLLLILWDEVERCAILTDNLHVKEVQ